MNKRGKELSRGGPIDIKNEGAKEVQRRVYSGGVSSE